MTTAACARDARPEGRQRAAPEPRLLPSNQRAGPLPLAGHLARYGHPPWRGLCESKRALLLDEVARSGLAGRGGAGFSTDRKLTAVAAGMHTVVVANGTEGEPASAKDKVLLAMSPHLVLDGVALAAELTGASRAVISVHHAVREIVSEAVAERIRAGLDRVPVRVVTAADRFTAGEASAVVHWIERGVPTPTARPPRLSVRGLGGRPTLVHNVETLAHLGLIGRYGARWFRTAGTDSEPGTMLVTVLGAVHRPCVQEIGIGTPVGEVLELAGGPAVPLAALLIGGYFGSWVSPAEALPAPLSRAGLAAAGASPGAGVIAALPATACGLTETARITRYLAGESAGQCGPCLFGLAAIAGQLEQIADGRSSDLTLLRRWLGQADGRGACSHPDGAVRLVRSALRVFAEELDRHAAGWCCGTTTAPVLPVPGRRPLCSG